METGNEEIDPDEQRRGAWLNRLADEFHKIGRFAIDWNLPDGDSPAWVVSVEKEVGSVAFPGAKLKTSKALTPSLMGAVLGHQCAYAVWMKDWLAGEIDEPDTGGKVSLTDDEVRKADAVLESLGTWYSRLRRLAKRGLCSSVDQTYGDMSEFLLAYASGFAKKPKAGMTGDIGSTTFEIYIFLLVYWRSVERFGSVAELHSVLRKALGEYRTGDLKRVEKICQRMGLHYRKPGRPQKPK